MLSDYKSNEVKQERKPMLNMSNEKYQLNSILLAKLTYFLNYLQKNVAKIDEQDFLVLKISSLFLKLVICNDKSEYKDILSNFLILIKNEISMKVLLQLSFYECILFFLDDFEQFCIAIDILLVTWIFNFNLSNENVLINLADNFQSKRVRI